MSPGVASCTPRPVTGQSLECRSLTRCTEPSRWCRPRGSGPVSPVPCRAQRPRPEIRMLSRRPGRRPAPLPALPGCAWPRSAAHAEAARDSDSRGAGGTTALRERSREHEPGPDSTCGRPLPHKRTRGPEKVQAPPARRQRPEPAVSCVGPGRTGTDIKRC